MSDAPLAIVLDMVVLLIENAVSTMAALLGMLIELFSSISVAAGMTGAAGILIGGIIVTVVVFFLAKFFFGSIKMIALLVGACVLVMLLLMIGSSQV